MKIKLLSIVFLLIAIVGLSNGALFKIFLKKKPRKNIIKNDHENKITHLDGIYLYKHSNKIEPITITSDVDTINYSIFPHTSKNHKKYIYTF